VQLGGLTQINAEPEALTWLKVDIGTISAKPTVKPKEKKKTARSLLQFRGMETTSKPHYKTFRPEVNSFLTFLATKL
jgi:hypothetical protein